MTSSKQFETDVVLGDEDVTVTVTYVPGTRVPANFGGHPDSWTPDESEECEILSVVATDEDGNEEDVFNQVSNSEILQACWDDLDDYQDDWAHAGAYDEDDYYRD